jgi:Golgi nucleoside diphosphatase
MGLCGMYAAGLLPGALLEEPVSYAIVVDGGSSGSRVHVFSMYIRRGQMPALKAEEGVLKVKPGLSSFRDDPTQAGASLQPLFTFAEKYVPHGGGLYNLNAVGP